MREAKRAKQERDVALKALEHMHSALAVTRDDLLRAVARGRLSDVSVLWTSGIASEVVMLDGRVDVERLEFRIRELVGAGTVGAKP